MRICIFSSFAAEMDRPLIHLFRQKGVLFPLLVVLGLFFCYPLTVRATDFQQTALESLTVKEPVSFEGVQKTGFVAFVIVCWALAVSLHASYPKQVFCVPEFRRYGKLLPSAGSHPSAP
jgi:hypothetical protein